MAKPGARVAVTLACTDCKRRNYQTKKSKRNTPDRMELAKFCRPAASTRPTGRPGRRLVAIEDETESGDQPADAAPIGAAARRAARGAASRARGPRTPGAARCSSSASAGRSSPRRSGPTARTSGRPPRSSSSPSWSSAPTSYALDSVFKPAAGWIVDKQTG